jgi:protein involved in polysaccharide export with SLBB domain
MQALRTSRLVSCQGGGACGRRPALLATAALLCGVLGGCAALTNPVAEGVPVRRLPTELLGESKEGRRPLPLDLLRQPEPEAYRLAAGDVLGVWVEGVVGEPSQVPPVHFPESANLAPSLGFPLPVRGDGTAPLPMTGPLQVQGLTVEEAQDAVLRAYTVDKKILQPGRARVLVTLLRRRSYRVLVFREDAGGPGPVEPVLPGTRSVGITLTGGATAPGLKRSAGFAVDLPAYENDVLHALALTGGLPGLDAVNEVVIQRRAPAGGRPPVPLEAAAGGLAEGGGQTVRIPLRVRPGEAAALRPEDVILNAGDAVYIASRDAELFYTGGLLPAGQYPLPRDRDLDVVQAIALVGGPIASGGLSGAAESTAGSRVQVIAQWAFISL